MIIHASKAKELSIISNFEQFSWIITELNCATWKDVLQHINFSIEFAASKGNTSISIKLPVEFNNVKYKDSQNKYLKQYFELFGYKCEEYLFENYVKLCIIWS